MTAKKTAPEVVNIDTDYAIVRAAQTLDKTFDLATALNDTKAALEVVNGWLTIAALLDEDTTERVETRIGFYHDE